jgi:hypothetical protein
MTNNAQEKPTGCYTGETFTAADLPQAERNLMAGMAGDGQARPRSGKKRGLRQSLNLFERGGHYGPLATHAAANMPPLTWEESLVWLCAAPGVKQLVFNAATAAGVIAYDKTTARWHGCEVNPSIDAVNTKEQQRI